MHFSDLLHFRTFENLRFESSRLWEICKNKSLKFAEKKRRENLEESSGFDFLERRERKTLGLFHAFKETSGALRIVNMSHATYSHVEYVAICRTCDKKTAVLGTASTYRGGHSLAFNTNQHNPT
jgi:hypothetical protein